MAFKWLNLELYDDEFGDKHWKVIEGELFEVQQANPNTFFGSPNPLVEERWIMPKYWAAKVNGHIKKVYAGQNVVRLLIPIIKGS